MKQMSSEKSHPKAPRVIEANEPGVPVAEWIWKSKEGQTVRVARFRSQIDKLSVASGVLKLQRAILLQVSADHFFVERRRATTFDSNRFGRLLERLFGRDGETRTVDGAREEWAALSIVFLDMVAHDRKRRFDLPELSSSLKPCVASGRVQRVSGWIEGLAEEDLATLSHAAYKWLPGIVFWMAAQSGELGPVQREGWEVSHTRRGRNLVNPQVVSLGLRWPCQPFDSRNVEVDGMTRYDRVDVGDLLLTRASLEDADVVRLRADDPQAWTDVRPIETTAHVSEIVRLSSYTTHGTIGLAAVETTWESPTDPNVVPSLESRSMFPKASAKDKPHPEHRIRVHVRHAWWTDKVPELRDGVGLRLLGLAMGWQLVKWIAWDMALRVKPGTKVSVHVSRAHGRSDLDDLLETMIEEFPLEDLGTDPDRAVLDLDVHPVPGRPKRVPWYLQQLGDSSDAIEERPGMRV